MTFLVTVEGGGTLQCELILGSPVLAYVVVVVWCNCSNLLL